MTTNNFLFNDLDVVHIIKPKIKHSYISVTHEAKVVLKTPKVSQRFVQNLLKEKEAWIKDKLNMLKENPPIKVNMEDEVLLYGDIFSMDMPIAEPLRVKLEKIKNSSPQNISKCYDSFYKDCSKDYITSRVEYFSAIMQLEYLDIKFRKMKRRWGSCSSKKTLTFNTELIKTKKELIDYVVVHELAHITHMNHSRDFHALVQNYLPNSKDHRKELKKIKFSTF